MKLDGTFYLMLHTSVPDTWYWHITMM